MSGAFNTLSTPISGVFAIDRIRRGDHRGFLSRLFSADEFAQWGWAGPIAQVNHTYTALRGTIRGMHFQVPPKAEKKLVICLKGSVCDVAVDLRNASPTFLRSHMEILTRKTAGRSSFRRAARMAFRR